MLTKIHIENFKSLKNVDVPCSGLNLLTGVNGAGKSSFIQMMKILFATADGIESLDQEIRAEQFELGFDADDVWYCYRRENPQICVQFNNDSGMEFELRRILELCEASEKPGTFYLRHPAYFELMYDAYKKAWDLENEDWDSENTGINVPPEDIRVAREEGDKKIAKLEKDVQKQEGSDVGVYNVYKKLWHGARFVDSFRHKPESIHEGGAYNWLFFALKKIPAFKSFSPEGQNTIEFLYKSGADLIEKVNACLNWVSPGARLNIERKQVGSRECFIETFDYGVNGDSRLFKPQNVGFGVSYILPVLVTLLTAKKGSILVIENPEAHLHPRGQAEIGKLIAETVARGVQVFIETHSDHVINGIRVAVKKGVLKPSDVNIAFFERKEHEVVDEEGKKAQEIYSTVRDIKIDKNGSLSEYPEDFMDEWNNQLMRLM